MFVVIVYLCIMPNVCFVVLTLCPHPLILLLQGSYAFMYPSLRHWYSAVFKVTDSSQKVWVQILSLSFFTCITLGKFLNFCVPQYIKDANSTCLLGLL